MKRPIFPQPISLQIVIAIFLFGFLSQTASAKCEIDREISFAGMSWMSNLVAVEIERKIIEKGYGCKTVVESGETLPMLAAVARGDVDVYTELWVNSVSEAWTKAEKQGKVMSLGDMYTGGVEAWWIPKYVADKYPELKSVSDLPKYKKIFDDPEEPGKGRFYTCPEGWACEIVNGNLFKAYGLEKDYVLFSPGSGAALKAAISSAFKRKKPIVFYYWTPTAVLGKYEVVKLATNAHDSQGHQCNIRSDCKTPHAGAYPVAKIEKGVSKAFMTSAPKLGEFIKKVNVPTEVVNSLLAWGEENTAEAPEVADYFLKNYAQLWTTWVPSDVASKVKSSL